jgi:putative membrane protein
VRIVLAVIHLLALGIGLGAIYARARALNRVGESSDILRTAFQADTWWGIAAMLWISTGLWRWFGSMEKSASYYMTNHIFYAKMGFLVMILLLELLPMMTLIRWRGAKQKGALPAPQELGRLGKRLARISDVQTLLVICMVVAAVMMARGYGAR